MTISILHHNAAAFKGYDKISKNFQLVRQYAPTNAVYHFVINSKKVKILRRNMFFP